jgi:hypothetical protein
MIEVFGTTPSLFVRRVCIHLLEAGVHQQLVDVSGTMRP